MICRTADEAFAAGMADNCDHGTDPSTCSVCRLSDAEVASLRVLFQHLVRPAAPAVPVRDAA